MNNILAGMQILAKYNPDFEVAAQHDQIWIGPGLIQVSSEDKKILEDLNWFVDSEIDESWTHFT